MFTKGAIEQKGKGGKGVSLCLWNGIPLWKEKGAFSSRIASSFGRFVKMPVLSRESGTRERYYDPEIITTHTVLMK